MRTVHIMHVLVLCSVVSQSFEVIFSVYVLSLCGITTFSLKLHGWALDHMTGLDYTIAGLTYDRQNYTYYYD